MKRNNKYANAVWPKMNTITLCNTVVSQGH